ncbi:MAG: lamin tail domain-containing protein [Candidatus Bipolaricaulota bacterium]
MKRSFLKYLLISGVLIGLLGSAALASSGRRVEISEVAWAGTEASWADEWIELRNLTDEKIDLSGWKLTWEETEIPLGEESEDTLSLRETVLGPEEVFLLERSDDETISTREADLIFKGSLANSGEKLVLKDEKDTVVHEVDGIDGWPAGTGADGEPPYASMVLLDGEWRTSESTSEDEDAEGNEVYGTPGTVPEEED